MHIFSISEKASSEESLPSALGSIDEDFDVPMKRKGLLPPIKMETNLPGGINFATSPEVPRRTSVFTTISTSHSKESLDESLAQFLTPPQDWLDTVKDSQNEYTTSDVLNAEWLKYCLECLLNMKIIEEFNYASKEEAIKVLLRDIIFVQKLKEVSIVKWL